MTGWPRPRSVDSEMGAHAMGEPEEQDSTADAAAEAEQAHDAAETSQDDQPAAEHVEG